MTRITTLALTVVMVLGPSSAFAHLLMNTPDGRVLELKEGTAQPDLSSYRSPLKAQVRDRRFYTGDAQYAANEMFFIAQTGFTDMVRAVFPLRRKRAFAWVNHQEAYWYARWSMGFGAVLSHCGISMIHGPYWTLKAQELSRKNRLQRDRGERPLSNKDVLMGFYLPLLYKRVGIPRVFDDVQPSYLEYASGMPFFTGEVTAADDFDDPQSDKRGGWGVPRYWYDARPFRWDHDSMDVSLDLGAIGQTSKRRSVWIAYMFKANHIEDSPSGTGEKITLLGNDAEEGLRGAALTWMNTNQLLALKAQLVADESGRLGGVNPMLYRPDNGLRYFPHLIHPNLVMLGDLPERPWDFDVKDSRSLLWDQASLLWATTEYFHQVYRLPEVFTANPPVDGGLVEKTMGQVARGLSNMLVRNLAAMHLDNGGLLVSEWSPKGRSGTTVSVKDLAMAILALREYVDRYHEYNAVEALGADEDEGIDPELTQRAMEMLIRQGDFLLEVQADDGSFNEGYEVVSHKGTGKATVARSQFAAIRGLLAAYHATAEERYVRAARKTWNLLARNYYDEPSGLFRTVLDSDFVTLTPYDLGIQIGAIRELMFTTPVHLVEPLLEWYPRWWVQTVNTSGLQQSEGNRTGELFYGVRDADFDNDGIPFFGKGPGRHGIAPVLAGQVAVLLAGESSPSGKKLKGEWHDPSRWGGNVQYSYQPGSLSPPVLAVTVEGDDLIERSPMKRFDGMTYPLPASAPYDQPNRQLSGRQLIESEANCVLCHGWTGEGITGLSWHADAFERDRDSMFEIPKFGRSSRLMPEWGLGHQDDMGSVLSDEEIFRIVDYVQGDEFRTLMEESQRGIIHPQFPPKDAYFYISRAYLKGRKAPATEKDILTVLEAYERAVATNTKVNVLELLGVPGAADSVSEAAAQPSLALSTKGQE